MKVAVLVAADGAGWEERFVTAFERGSHPIEIVRRCVDVADLLAVASTGTARAALVSAQMRRLDREVLARLGRDGVAVILLYSPGDEAAQPTHRSISEGGPEPFLSQKRGH